MGFNILLPIRVFQATFSIIIIGLSGFVAHWYNTNTTYLPPSQISFLLFCGVYSLVSVFYLGLISKLFPKTSNPYAVLSLEITNLLFWFAGFVSLSGFLSKLLFCRGSVCGAARADVGIAACLSVSWIVTVAVLARDALRSGGFEGFRGNIGFLRHRRSGSGSRLTSMGETAGMSAKHPMPVPTAIMKKKEGGYSQVSLA
ncbi:hypothetical protein QBC32DRAFT_347142 [Pseudoneurospora amorphoporcata]|uniref:MARVEL domain-containing protein n=1 Tax=Pseudoneurospora amorphoporcata TaxID=241081 RepID=A0AAN6NSI8_9PEZI|nr:hypothetical protein QBC32DRAFT_347142 [Pseudoneurospora amorphoporcata]